MVLKVLEDSLKNVLIDIEKKAFPNLISECREALGLKMFRAAEYAGMQKARLNNLELGLFSSIPKKGEIEGISDLYNIDKEILIQKAIEHVKTIKSFKSRKKITADEIRVSNLPKTKRRR